MASHGRVLDAGERAFFEPRFGRDLSHVRLHDDPDTARTARDIGARAFTIGDHIGFAGGQHDMRALQGRRVFAHEIAHTIQPRGAVPVIRRIPDGFGMNDDEFRRPRDPFAPMSRDRDDPRGPGGRSTLTYRQARELNRCIEVMGDDAWGRASCGNTVLGTPIPDWLSVEGVSTPVPSTASPRTGGGATMQIGPVTLTILPDTRTSDPAMADKAKTQIIPEQLPSGANLVDGATMNNRVTSFTVHPAAFRLSIRTTYGPGVTARSTSGYGRGRAQSDRDVGNTSLGFHEGEHGRDFITFLRNNPYPAFTGRNGQSAAVFSNRIDQFEAALQAYVSRMNRASELATDCAGEVTIDDFNATNGTATTTCVVQPGDPTP